MFSVETGLPTGLSVARAPLRVQTLFLEGELSLVELGALEEELFRLANRGRFQVVLEMASVSHLDYRGVRSLSSRAELFRRAGGDIKLAALSPYLQAIFRAAGAHQAFELYASAHDAAMAFVSNREG
jgi:anti-sigma B factor antagonist